MVDVAHEMERRGLDLPLLIGGATTSRQHTAVKIAPEYEQPVVHVHDASRVVGVVGDLLDPTRRARLDGENRDAQERCASSTPRRSASRCCRSTTRGRVARASPFVDLAPRRRSSARASRARLETLREYIDWQFFFHAWELKGKFPAILDQPAARELYDDAQELLDEIVRDKLLQARGVYGFWPAAADGDDVVVDGNGRASASSASSPRTATRVRTARLADYVAPAGDHIGAFAVTAGIGADELTARFEAEHDDYRSIMVKALADRLAEAFAEYLHEVARREWYETGPQLSKEDLIAERFRGIRPAFGYPACPDHSEKRKLFELLGAEDIGIALTESYAMIPAASVSGIYLGHPEARYFSVGRVGRDQVEDYAARKGMPLDEAERWLRPNLGYEPPRAEPERCGIPQSGEALHLGGRRFLSYADDAEERDGSRVDPQRQRPRGTSASGARPDAALPAAAAAVALDRTDGRQGVRLDRARAPRRRLRPRGRPLSLRARDAERARAASRRR